MSGVLQFVINKGQSAAKTAGVAGSNLLFPGEAHPPLSVNGSRIVANFMGPGTQLRKRMVRGDQPVSDIDTISLAHDLRYMLARNQKDIREADHLFLQKAKSSSDTVGNKALGLTAIGTKYAAETLSGVKYPTPSELARNTEEPFFRTRLDTLVQQGYGMSETGLLSKISNAQPETKKQIETKQRAALHATLTREQIIQATNRILYPEVPLTAEQVLAWKSYFIPPDAGNPQSSTSYETALNLPPDNAVHELQMAMGKPIEGDSLGLLLPNYRNSLIRDEQMLSNEDYTEDNFTMLHPLELAPIRRGYASQILPHSMVRPTESARWNAPAVHDMTNLKVADKQAQIDTIKEHDSAMGKIHGDLVRLDEERDALLLEAKRINDIYNDPHPTSDANKKRRVLMAAVGEKMKKVDVEIAKLERVRASGLFTADRAGYNRAQNEGAKLEPGVRKRAFEYEQDDLVSNNPPFYPFNPPSGYLPPGPIDTEAGVSVPVDYDPGDDAGALLLAPDGPHGGPGGPDPDGKHGPHGPGGPHGGPDPAGGPGGPDPAGGPGGPGPAGDPAPDTLAGKIRYFVSKVKGGIAARIVERFIHLGIRDPILTVEEMNEGVDTKKELTESDIYTWACASEILGPSSSDDDKQNVLDAVVAEIAATRDSSAPTLITGILGVARALKRVISYPAVAIATLIAERKNFESLPTMMKAIGPAGVVKLREVIAQLRKTLAGSGPHTTSLVAELNQSIANRTINISSGAAMAPDESGTDNSGAAMDSGDQATLDGAEDSILEGQRFSTMRRYTSTDVAQNADIPAVESKLAGVFQVGVAGIRALTSLVAGLLREADESVEMNRSVANFYFENPDVANLYFENPDLKSPGLTASASEIAARSIGEEDLVPDSDVSPSELVPLVPSAVVSPLPQLSRGDEAEFGRNLLAAGTYQNTYSKADVARESRMQELMVASAQDSSLRTIYDLKTEAELQEALNKSMEEVRNLQAESKNTKSSSQDALLAERQLTAESKLGRQAMALIGRRTMHLRSDGPDGPALPSSDGPDGPDLPSSDNTAATANTKFVSTSATVKPKTAAEKKKNEFHSTSATVKPKTAAEKKKNELAKRRELDKVTFASTTAPSISPITAVEKTTEENAEDEDVAQTVSRSVIPFEAANKEHIRTIYSDEQLRTLYQLQKYHEKPLHILNGFVVGKDPSGRAVVYKPGATTLNSGLLQMNPAAKKFMAAADAQRHPKKKKTAAVLTSPEEKRKNNSEVFNGLVAQHEAASAPQTPKRNKPTVLKGPAEDTPGVARAAEFKRQVTAAKKNKADEERKKADEERKKVEDEVRDRRIVARATRSEKSSSPVSDDRQSEFEELQAKYAPPKKFVGVTNSIDLPANSAYRKNENIRDAIVALLVAGRILTLDVANDLLLIDGGSEMLGHDGAVKRRFRMSTALSQQSPQPVAVTDTKATATESTAGGLVLPSLPTLAEALSILALPPLPAGSAPEMTKTGSTPDYAQDVTYTAEDADGLVANYALLNLDEKKFNFLMLDNRVPAAWERMAVESKILGHLKRHPGQVRYDTRTGMLFVRNKETDSEANTLDADTINPLIVEAGKLQAQNGWGHRKRSRALLDDYSHDGSSHVSDGYHFASHLTKYARH